MPEPRDADRLFAASIIEYIGALRSLNRNGILEILRHDQHQRDRLLEHLDDEEAEGEADEKVLHANKLLRQAISELNAFDVIERVRRASRPAISDQAP